MWIISLLLCTVGWDSGIIKTLRLCISISAKEWCWWSLFWPSYGLWLVNISIFQIIFFSIDLKKTFAVLLQNIFERLTHLENKVANLTLINHQITNSSAEFHAPSDINYNNSNSQILRNPLDSQRHLDFSGD